jgi:hypothetical protein
LPAHPDLLSAFSAGLASGALPPGMTALDPTEAARRFAVYRNNVAVSLIKALARRFPVIERLVGTAPFRTLALAFLQAHRPETPVLFEWGQSFPEFLSSFPPLAAHPVLPDVARIELARGQAYHAADAEPIAAALLMATAANPAEAHLFLHPSVQVLRLNHPAVSVWTRYQPGQTSTAPFPAGPETALVFRDRTFGIPVRTIGPGDTALITALLAGEPLLTAAELAAFAEPDHNPEAMLVHLMQAGVIIMPKEPR